jgi:inward rectifier potassium channel
VAPFKNNLLSEAEVTISAIEENIEGKLESKFYLLEPKLKKINTFSLNWTIVHKIDSNSPFYEYTKKISKILILN